MGFNNRCVTTTFAFAFVCVFVIVFALVVAFAFAFASAFAVPLTLPLPLPLPVAKRPFATHRLIQHNLHLVSQLPIDSEPPLVSWLGVQHLDVVHLIKSTRGPSFGLVFIDRFWVPPCKLIRCTTSRCCTPNQIYKGTFIWYRNYR